MAWLWFCPTEKVTIAAPKPASTTSKKMAVIRLKPRCTLFALTLSSWYVVDVNFLVQGHALVAFRDGQCNRQQTVALIAGVINETAAGEFVGKDGAGAAGRGALRGIDSIVPITGKRSGAAAAIRAHTRAGVGHRLLGGRHDLETVPVEFGCSGELIAGRYLYGLHICA